MDMLIRHWKVIDDIDEAVKIALPVDVPSRMHIFRHRWTVEPRRVVNWTQTFQDKLGLDYLDYNYLGAKEEDSELVHRFIDKEAGVSLTRFVQAGDPDAIRQGDVITYRAHVPVLNAVSCGVAEIISVQLGVDQLVSELNWATDLDQMARFQGWLYSLKIKAAWPKRARDVIFDRFCEGSFLQVMPA